MLEILFFCFFFQAEDGIRYSQESRGLGDVYKRQGDDWVDMTLPGPDNRGRAKPYIGILYQEYDLYPFRDVLDNLTSSIGLELPAELSEHKAVQTLMAAGFSETKSEGCLLYTSYTHLTL